MKFTIETLKENREQIIEQIKKLGCEHVIKDFMQIVKLEVEMGTREDSIEDLVLKVWDSVFRASSRKTTAWVEARATAVHEGRQDEFNINTHYSNKAR
jgi:hypothetical protein